MGKSRVDERILLEFKNDLITMISQMLPGYISLLNTILRKKGYGSHVVDLVIEDPLKVIELLKTIYNDEVYAENVFYEVFIRSIARITGYRISEEEIYNAIKNGRGRDVMMKVIDVYSKAKTRR